MGGAEHQQPIAAHAVKMDALAPAHRCSETGRNAPRTPCVEMDAAVLCSQAVCSNALRSVVVALTPQFARLYEQAGYFILTRSPDFTLFIPLLR